MSAMRLRKPNANRLARGPELSHNVGFGGTNGAQPRSRTTCTVTDTASNSAIAPYSHLFEGRRSTAVALMTASLEIAAAEDRDRRGQQRGDIDCGIREREQHGA